MDRHDSFDSSLSMCPAIRLSTISPSYSPRVFCDRGWEGDVIVTYIMCIMGAYIIILMSTH